MDSLPIGPVQPGPAHFANCRLAYSIYICRIWGQGIQDLFFLKTKKNLETPLLERQLDPQLQRQKKEYTTIEIRGKVYQHCKPRRREECCVPMRSEARSGHTSVCVGPAKAMDDLINIVRLWPQLALQ